METELKRYKTRSAWASRVSMGLLALTSFTNNHPRAADILLTMAVLVTFVTAYYYYQWLKEDEKLRAEILLPTISPPHRQ